MSENFNSWVKEQIQIMNNARQERLRKANNYYTQVLTELGYEGFELDLSLDDGLRDLKFLASDDSGFIDVSCYCHGYSEYDGSGDIIYFDIPEDCRDVLEAIKRTISVRQNDYAEQLIYALKSYGFYSIKHEYRIGSPHSKLRVIFKKMDRKYELNISRSFYNHQTYSTNNRNVNHNFDNMDGPQFETFCANLLAKLGYEDVVITQGSGDQGVDVIAYKDGIKYGFQCKCYSSTVGNKAVQEVFAGKSFYQCHVGIVITNNYFTDSAKDLAKSNGIVLWDRNKLLELIDKSTK